MLWKLENLVYDARLVNTPNLCRWSEIFFVFYQVFSGYFSTAKWWQIFNSSAGNKFATVGEVFFSHWIWFAAIHAAPKKKENFDANIVLPVRHPSI